MRISADECISILLKSWILTHINMIHVFVHLRSFATPELYSVVLRAEATPLQNEQQHLCTLNLLFSCALLCVLTYHYALVWPDCFVLQIVLRVSCYCCRNTSKKECVTVVCGHL